jgi:hypothetical protein
VRRNENGGIKMNSTEKIRDFIILLTINEEHLYYELTSLAAKVNNFLDDRERSLSGRLLSVMYNVLTEQNINETVETGADDLPEKANPCFERRHLALA